MKSEANRLNIDLFIEEDKNICINPWRSKKLDIGSNDMNFAESSPEYNAHYDGEKGPEIARLIWSSSDDIVIKHPHDY